MQCKSCNYPHSRVVSTDKDERLNQIVRRRECTKCGARYTTHEHFRDEVSNSTFKTLPPKKVLEK